MRSDTQSLSVSGNPGEVFAFLADPENLPRWAVGFCRAIRHDPERGWIVETSTGEVPIRYVAHLECGTLDFYMQVGPGVEIGAYSRVIPNGDAAVYVFTQLQAPGMPDSLFESQVVALAEELRVLQGIFRARAACVS
jgi:hypothetical protein